MAERGEQRVIICSGEGESGQSWFLLEGKVLVLDSGLVIFIPIL